MVQSQFSLCWDSYKTTVCNGFSALQQNGEFVDMTLAADGHFVKVHQMLVALASPYLKDLITSAPCQHPVIFLNNISNRTLCSLLEYIYTGEVIVRADNLNAFVDAARALHIKGLENIASDENIKPTIELPVARNENNVHITRSNKRLVLPSFEPTEQVNIPGTAQRIYIKPDAPSLPTVKPGSVKTITHQDDIHEYPEMMDDWSADDNELLVKDTSTVNTRKQEGKESSATNLQFTVSIRGSLQMILNRYIYNLNSTTTRAGVRRWRCVDYRNNKCSAFVITRGNMVLKRANPHNHSFHDKKILAKMEKKAVFSALEDIQAYNEKEQRRSDAGEDSNNMSMEQDNFNLEDFDSDVDVKSDTLLIKKS